MQLQVSGNIATAASLGLIANVIFGALALFSVVALIPKQTIAKLVKKEKKAV